MRISTHPVFSIDACAVIRRWLQFGGAALSIIRITAAGSGLLLMPTGAWAQLQQASGPAGLGQANGPASTATVSPLTEQISGGNPAPFPWLPEPAAAELSTGSSVVTPSPDRSVLGAAPPASIQTTGTSSEAMLPAPDVLRNFSGFLPTGYFPPNPSIAVGPRHVIVAVDSNWSIYTKAGTQEYTSTLASWFASMTPPGTPFSPKVIYDAHAGRWVMVALARGTTSGSSYLISVSETSNPVGNWWNWKLDAGRNDSTATGFYADAPGLGYDSSEAVYITSNQYSFAGAFQYSKLRILRKVQLYSAGTGGALDWKDLWNELEGDGVAAFNWKPAQAQSALSGTYLVATRWNGASHVTLWRLTNPLATSPTLTRQATISVGAYGVPPSAIQAGGTAIDTGDCRTQDIKFQSGVLTTAWTEAYNWGGGNVSAVRALSLNATTNVVLLNSTHGEDLVHYYCPAIVQDPTGNYALVFNRSASDEFVSARYTVKFTTDTTWRASGLVQAGQANYVRLDSANRNRWGDYNAAAIDPADTSRIWVHAEYARTGNTWGTWIGEVPLAAPPPGNDSFAGRITVTGSSGAATGSNIRATKEAGEPDHYSSGGKSVWWEWTAPASGPAVIDTLGSSFDTLLAVYTGTAVNALTLIASNDDTAAVGQSQVTFTAVSGTVYKIAVDGYSAYSGAITLNWWVGTPTTVSVAATDASAGEPSEPGTFTFTRTGDTTGALTVNFTVAGTATAGTDYTLLGTTVGFTAGSSTATKTVTVVDDTVAEASETVILTLATGMGYFVGTPSAATVTITDNDVGNLPPTLAAINDPAAVLEDFGAQTVNLTGISAGADESQTLTITAASSNPSLIPNPTVTYTSPSATGSLSYTPVANASGAATITVTVTDNGGTANGSVDTISRPFTATVTPVNDAPTLDAIADPPSIAAGSGAQTVNLSGISAGTGESQTLTVTAASSNRSLIPNPTVTYTSPSATGSLSYTPVSNGSGTATITVTVTDNGGTANGGVPTISRTFTVVAKASQTIAFGLLAPKRVADAPFALTATASSGLPVSYSSSNLAVATVSGSTVTMVGEGTTTITAQQPGNANYDAAADVARLLEVSISAPTTTAVFNTATDVPVVANGYVATARTLNASLGFTPPPGTSLTVVKNTGAAFIDGTFLNVAHNQTVTLTYGGNSYNFVANYFGGTGNDLVLEWTGSRGRAVGDNRSGQLATGNTDSPSLPITVATGVRAMASGSEHDVYLLTTGALWAAGGNGSGQLGDGTNTPRLQLVLVASGVSSVAAGASYTMFIKSNGTLWATGDNAVGQLGDGTNTSRNVPVQVASGVVAVAAGWYHTLFIKTDRTLWATGHNEFAQLGDGTTTFRNTPVQVATDVTAIACGSKHSLFVKSDGTLWTMGNNTHGQLGIGIGFGAGSSPSQITSGVQSVSAGQFHSLFIKTDGTLWAMGNNASGQLGDGSNQNRGTPVLIATGVRVAAAGVEHSAFVKTDGTLWTFGSNELGQQGNGTTTPRTTPAQVASDVVTVVAGPISRATLFIDAIAIPTITSPATASGTYGASFSGYTVAANNAPTSFSASGLPAGLTIDPTTGAIGGTPTAIGSASVTLGASNAAGTGTATLTLTIAKGTATVALGGLSATYDGTAKAATATTTPAGLAVIFSYSPGGATAPSAVGSYVVTATINDANYTGSATGTLVISGGSLASFTTQPANQMVVAGGTATFAVVASGTGTLNYQWYFTAAGGGTPQPLSDGGPYAGTHTATLTVTDVQSTAAGDYVCTVTNAGGTATSQAAQLLFAARSVSVTGQAVAAGATVVVPVLLEATGAEGGVGFSLTFNPAQLTYVSTVVGAQSADASLNVNASSSAAGRIGVTLAKNAGGTWTAGKQELVKITFTVATGLPDGTVAALAFGNTPVAQEVSLAAADALVAAFQGANLMVVSGYEADMNGSGLVTVTDWVKVGRIVAGLDVVPAGVDFARADCAPRSSFGNGSLTVSDWVQAGRYHVGLDAPALVGGPFAVTAAIPAGPAAVGGARTLALVVAGNQMTATGTAQIVLTSQGDENALGFSVTFDPAVLRYDGFSNGANLGEATLNVNVRDAALGRVGYALSRPPGASFPAGSLQLVVLNFAVLGQAASTMLGFGNSPVLKEIANAAADELPATYTPLTIATSLVVAQPVITSAATAGGTVGVAFGYTVAASGSPTLFGAVGLPAGLAINATTGAITGTPTVAGTFTVSLTATNAAGTGNGTLTLTIVDYTTLTLTGSGDVGTAAAPLATSATRIVLNKSAGNTFLATAGAVTLEGDTGTGSLYVSAGGAITQGGTSVVVGGTTSLNAGANAITLTNSGNDFTGAVSISSSGANNVAVTDTNALKLGAVSVGTGALTVKANQGGTADVSGITQLSGTTITSSGPSSFIGGAGQILINNANNNFGTVSVSNSGANNVSVRDETGGIVLGASSVGSNLTVHCVGGDITQNGVLTLPGILRLIAGTNDITLEQNNSLQRLVVESAKNASIKAVAAASLGDNTGTATGVSNITGNFTLNAGGAVTQTEALTVGGTTSIVATVQNVTLTNTANALTGQVNLTGEVAQLTNTLDTTALLTTTANTTLTATGKALTVSGNVTASKLTTSAGATTLGTLTVGSVDLTATGVVTQTGVLTDAGTLKVTAMGQDITLTQNNAVTGLVDLTGKVTQFTNTKDTTALLTTTGNTTLTATGKALTAAGNVTASKLTTSAGATTLGTLTVDSADLTATGAVTQTAVLTDAGTLKVTAMGQDITLSQNNSIAGTATLAGKNVSIKAASNLAIGHVTVGGNVTVSTVNSAALSLLENVTVTGATVTLDIAGALTQASGKTITGATLNLSGIGAVGGDPSLGGSNRRLETAVDTIVFNKGAGAGASWLREADAVTLTGTTQGAVNIVLTDTAANLFQTNLTATGGVFTPGVARLSFAGTLAGARTLAGDVTFTGNSTFSDAVSLAPGNITVGDSTVAFDGAVTLTGNTALNVSGGGGFEFGNNASINGAVALTLTLPAGKFTALRNVGGFTPLTSLTVGGAGTLQLGGTVTTSGPQTYETAVQVVAPSTLNSPGNIAFNSTVDSNGSASALTVNAAGLTTFGGVVGGSQRLGSLTTDGAGTTVIAGGAVGSTGNQTYNDAMTLAADTTLTTTNSAITLGAINSPTRALTLSPGTGTVTAGSVTTSVFAINGSGAATASGTVVATTLDLSGKTGGSATFQGNVTVTSLTTANASFSVSLTGPSTRVINDVNFLNTGTVTLGDGPGDVLLFTGGLATAGNASNPGTTSLGGSIRTDGQAIDLGAVSLLAAATVDSTNNGGNAAGEAIAVGAVTGNSNNFTLTPGTSGAISGTSTTTVGTLTLNGAKAATFSGPVAATTLDLSNKTAGSVTLQGNAAITTLTTGSGAYDLALTGASTAVTSGTAFTHTGTLTLGNEATDVLTFTNGIGTTGSATNPSSVTLAGKLRTAGGMISLGATTVSADSSIDSTNNGGTAAGAAIAVGAITAGSNSISLAAGTGGNITVAGMVSANAFTVTGADTITLSGVANATSASLTSKTLVLDANNLNVGTGHATLNQSVAVPSSTGSLVAGTLTLGGAGEVGSSWTPLVTSATALVLSKTAGNATVSALGGISLEGTTGTGSLTLGAAGAITQGSTALSVGGTTALDAGGNAITLANSANNFTGAVSLKTTGSNDISIRGANTLGLGTVTTTGNGSLTVNAGGNITDSGTLTVAGNLTVTGGADVTLDSSSNSFGGTLSLTVPTTANVTLVDTTSVDLPALTVATLGVIAGGAITQNGDLKVTGLANFKTQNNAGAAITLANAGNTFGSLGAQVRTGNDAADANATITLKETGGTTIAGIRTGGALVIDSTGFAIDQTGSIVVGGRSSVTAGAAAIKLDNAGNDFTGAVGLSNSGAFDVEIWDTNALKLGAVSVGTGALTVKANQGGTSDVSGITQLTGTTITSSGTASFIGGAGQILINNANNNFGTVSVSNSGANNVSVRDETGGIVLGASSVGLNLTVHSVGGDITQNGVLTVPGILRLIAGTNDTTLEQNNSLQRLVVESAKNASIKAVNGVSLGDDSGTAGGVSSVSGNFTLNSGGAVTQTEALAVGGSVSIIAPGQDVMLMQNNNSIAGIATLVGNNVSITAASNLVIGNVTLGGNFTVTTVNSAALSLLENITATGAVVTLDHAGALTQASGKTITAATLKLIGTGAVGGDPSLGGSNRRVETNVDVIVFNKGASGPPVVAAGDGWLREADAVTLTGFTQGAVNIVTGGTITVASMTAVGGLTSPAIVALGNLSANYDGTPKAATATTTPAGLAVTITYNGSATVPTAAGRYAVAATINDPIYTGSATGTLVIAVAATFASATDIPVTAARYTAAGNMVNLVLNYAPTPGTTLTVVKNTGLGFIQGAFSNLSQGQTVALSYNGKTYNFVANYYGGTGNDLVLQWADMQLVAWGWNEGGQTDIPAGLSGVVAISAGRAHNVALKANGTVVAWGRNTSGETNVPAGLSGVAIVTAGSYHSAVVKTDGTVVAWGYNSAGQANVPAGLSGVVGVAAGDSHTVALRSDGTLVGWGANDRGEITIPAGLSGVVAVAAGGFHTVALKSDGTVVAWGSNFYGETTVPADLSGVVAVGAGFGHTVALKGDGTVVVWGWNNGGVATVPAGLSGVAGISTTWSHIAALKGDGTVVAWGYNAWGQTNVPAGLAGVAAIAAGFDHTVALAPTVPGITSPATASATFGAIFGGYTVTASNSPTTFAATGLPAGLAINATTGEITGTPTAAGTFTVVLSATNAKGTGSAILTLTIAKGPAIVALGNLSGNYDGTPKAATATTTPTGLAVTLNYTPGGATAPTAAGSYAVTATINDANYAGSATGTLVIAKANQTITFAALAAKTFGNAAFALGATATSGLAVNYTSSNPAVATVSGSNVPIVGAGTTILTAKQAGDGNYNGATDVTQTLTVNKAAATVALGGLSATYDGTVKAATATTTPAGLSVTFTYTPGGATVPTAVGSYAVTATINDANYTGSATGTLVIAKANQTITFGTLAAKTFGNAAFALGATASSGLTVSYTSSNTAVATVSGNTVTIVGAGTTILSAKQTGDGNYNAATDVTQTLTVNKAAAAVALGNLSAIYEGTAKAATATTTPAGLSVIFNYTTGGAIAPTAAGTYAVTATINDANYAGSATGTLVIAKANQTITFGTLAAKTFGDAPFAVGSTATSGLAVNYSSSNPAVATVSGSNVTIVGAGTTILTAKQAGDGNYNGATDVTQTLTVNKAAATVALGGLSATYDGAAKAATATTTPAGLSVTFTYTPGGATVPVAAGSYAVVATINDANYTGSATGTLVIAKASQTLNFAAIANRPLTDSPFALDASASSGLAPTFRVVNGPATVSGATLTLTGEGAVVVRASQSGNTNYNAAPDIDRSFTVLPAVVTESYTFATLAGAAGSSGSTNGGGSAARFFSPQGIAVDAQGNLFVADRLNQVIRKISAGGVVTTLAGASGEPGTADGTGGAARFNSPIGVAVDTAGNLYVVDRNNNTIRKITSSGVVTTLAGTPSSGAAADGTGSAARFSNPYGVAVDTTGNIFVSDQNNHTIRKITSGGVVTTLAGLAGSFGNTDGVGSAARFFSPAGIVTDNAGNVFVICEGSHTLRKITSSGVVSTLAGGANGAGVVDGTGGSAVFAIPRGLAIDGAGNLYVADSYNHAIRKVTSAGVVTTIAGTGAVGSADGVGSGAQFNRPEGVAVDTQGNVYVGDTLNNTIRWGAVAAPVFTSAATASATVGTAFTYAVKFSGALTGFTASGLPAGLSLNSATGAIDGTATAAGVFSVTLGTANAAGTGSGTLSLAVAKGAATITLGALAQTFDGAPKPVTATTVPAGLAVTVTYNAIATVPTAVGSYSVQAALNVPNYTATALTGTLVIAKAAQTITFGSLGTKTLGDAPFTLGATASSGLAVSYTSSNPAVATISGSTVTVVGTGTTLLTAKQSGDANYNAASDVAQGLTVQSAQTAPVITAQPAGKIVAAGQNVTFTVTATGSPAPTYLWKKNGTTISGASATSASLTLTDVQGTDAGGYTVTVTNTAGNVTSQTALLAVVSAQQTVVGSGYIAGSTVTVANTITYAGTLSDLSWHVVLPDGWTYGSGGGQEGNVKPAVGTGSLLDWSWTTLPASPVSFTYTLKVPFAGSGVQALAALLGATQAGATFQILAKPDPLAVAPVVLHSADTDFDGRINLVELTRVIELYNTRAGTVRTGAYAVATTATEDGFVGDTARAGPATLARYHSADTDRDGRFSLVELTRVIELYNTRSGTVRTGAYHVQAGTEDGFSPGP